MDTPNVIRSVVINVGGMGSCDTLISIMGLHFNRNISK